MNRTVILPAAICVLLAATRVIRGDDEVPKRPELARYEPMMNRSPFAVATAVATPPPVSSFAKDLYIANAARSPAGDMVTVASSADKNLKLYLTTARPVDGYSISNIDWSERVGETKVTISKDGQFATIGFNQALLSAGIAATTAMPQQMQPGVVAPVQGAQNFGAQNALTGTIRPAPIPTLPSPPPRMRGVIPRVPQRETPAPVPDDSLDE